MISENLTSPLAEINMEEYSKYWLELSRTINLYVLGIAIVFGVLGNFLLILVYSKKKFCSNLTHIVLVFWSLNDNFFLIMHFFEVLFL